MKATDCADYIVDESIKQNLNITNLQLQKALYVFAAEYIRQCGKYPYDVEIMAWNYGPVIPKVYREYKIYESAPIKEVSKHETFDMKSLEFLENKYNVENIDLNYRQIVNDFLKKFLELDIFEVVKYTHKQIFWSNNKEKIFKYDNVEYPHSEINLAGKSLSDFIKDMRGTHLYE